MDQPALWDDRPAREEIIGSTVELYRDVFTTDEQRQLFEQLESTIQWRQDHITLFGKRTPLPRLTAWHGDADRSYTYSGIAMDSEPWTPALLVIRKRAQALGGTTFNSVLLNLYRDGRDSVSWHSDDEPELGREPVIASVSFGAQRRFVLRRRADHADRVSIDLPEGSVLVMSGNSQEVWEHSLPKTSRVVTPRINLTFRSIR